MVIRRALHLGELFDLGNFFEIVADALEHPLAKVLVGHLAAAETYRHLTLSPSLEETRHRPHLDVVVVDVDRGPHLDFLDVKRFLPLACRFAFFCETYLNLP